MRWLSAQGVRLTLPSGAARIDWASPLAIGLRDLVLPAGGRASLVTGRLPVRAGSGAYTQEPGKYGLARTYNRGAAMLEDEYAQSGHSGDITLFCVGRLNGTLGSGQRLVGLVTSGGTQRLWIGENSGSRYTGITAPSGGSTVAAQEASNSVGPDTVLVLRVSGTTQTLWSGGVLVATNTQSASNWSDIARLELGTTGFLSGPNGAIYAAGWAARAWADDEIRSFSANPGQLLQPERRIWVPVSAGGGSSTNLVIQSALHAHTADGPTLTTDSTLAIAEALHAHSADAPTLSTDLLLSVADALHGHAVESLTLDTGVALAVADATHGHTADGLTLVTDSALAVADALHAHAADNLTLTADGAVDLVIQDALHGHTADELTLSATGAGGYYDDPKRAPRKREKLTVIHKDDSDERSQEFEALLARVKGQALDKAKSAAQAAPVATPPADIKPPRMPEIRGVEAAALRQWMPDLLSTYREQYRAAYVAELQALASAQQAAAQAQWARQIDEDEEIAILAMLA